MTHVAHILAKSDFGGVIIFLIVIAFWALSALSNWIKKQQEEMQRRRVRDSLSTPATPAAGAARQGLPRAQPPWRPPAQAQRKAPAPAPRVQASKQPRIPAAVLQQPQQPQQARRAPKRQPPVAGRATPPPVPVGSPAPTVSATRQDIAATEIRSLTTGPGPERSLSRNASALHRWLVPATLRQQFILTELLQPPLALRNDRL